MSFNLMLFPNFREKAFTMSYDDGVRQDVRLIDIMKKNGLKGTFNLNSGFMSESVNLAGAPYLDPKDICDVYLKTENEIAVHGMKHLFLTAVSENRIIDEIINDRKNLESLTGTIVNGMAYPFGCYNDRVVGVLKKCEILYSRTVISTRNFEINDDWLRMPTTCHHNDEKLFELAEKFLTNKKEREEWWANEPKLFFLWGHSYEFDNDDNWDRIEKFAKIIGNHDDVWYATNGDIVRYIEAFKKLVYSVDGSVVFNPTSLDIYIKTVNEERFMIPSGKTVKIIRNI